MSTLSQLISQTRTYLVEPLPSFFTDAEITQWLNDGQVDASIKLPADILDSLMKIVPLNSVIGQSDYVVEIASLSDPILRIFSVHLVNQATNKYHAARYMSQNEFSTITSNMNFVDSPAGDFFVPLYRIVGKSSGLNIQIFPVYTSVIAEAIKVFCIVAPSKMVNSNDFPLISPYDYCLPFYAAARGKEKEEEYQLAQNFQKQYTDALGTVIQKYQGIYRLENPVGVAL